jgi:hypothetical protein
MRPFAVLFVTLALGCSSSLNTNQPVPAGAAGHDDVGKDCIAACGGDPALDCAVGSNDACGGGLCLVDLKSTGSLRTYCTRDCAAEECPAGFHCGAIDVIGVPGAQQGCIADVAVCNDGVRQVGEVCEVGETSELGTCKSDCSGFAGSCGDGKLQEGEQCEADTADAYCVSCKLAAPEVRISNSTIKLTAEQWPATHTGTVNGTHPLPTAGDTKQCGRYEIVENTTELVRIEFTHCNTTTNTRAKFRIAIPRNKMVLSPSSDKKWMPTAELAKIGEYATLTYDTVSKLSVQTLVGDGRTIAGLRYDIELVKYAVGGGGRAYLTFDFSLVPTPPK